MNGNGNKARTATRVLVVEDDRSARDAMRQYLQSVGYSVSVAASFEEAIEQAEAVLPDVLVCDWMLDGGDRDAGRLTGNGSADGVDTAVDLQHRHHHLPVILVTAQRLEELIARTEVTDLQVSCYRRKPVSLSAIAGDIDLLTGHP